jgi:hypothetical protein
MRKQKQTRSRLTLAWLIVTCLATLIILSGCWIKNIDTPYYTQDNSYYCGAASAQMILDSDKIGIYEDQDILYDDYIHPHNACSTGWATDPEGLRYVLNLYYPAGYFYVHKPLDADTGIKKIAYTIDKYGVPPASLIYHCGHWVVVRGTYTDVQPTKAIGSFAVYGFFVNDPWYGATSLGENKYIDVNTWKDDYFTGCSGWCAASGTRYISVVDPSPVPPLELILPKSAARRDIIISESEAKEKVAQYLKILMEYEEFRKNFDVSSDVLQESAINTPILVQRSDKKEDAYYIVSLSQDEMTNGAILIDAYSGQLKELSFVSEPINYVPKFEVDKATSMFKRSVLEIKVESDLLPLLKQEPSKQSLLKQARMPQPLLNQREKALPSPTYETTAKTDITYRELDISANDVRVTKMELVWEPGLEAQNPYYPIWEVKGSIGSLKQDRVLGYMDLDGQVFDNKKLMTIKGG